MAVRFAQLNMARCSAGMEDVRRFLEGSDIEVLMLQEPYARNNLNWPDCHIYTGAQGLESTWSLTIVRGTKYSAVLNMELSSSTCTVVELYDLVRGYGLVTVCSYFKYSEPIEPHLEKLEGVLRYYRGANIIIAADVNARSTLWYNPTTDERGEKLESFIVQHDLLIRNKPSELTTFENSRGHHSNIDVTLSTELRNFVISDWHIKDQSFLSDHRLMAFLVEHTGTSGRAPGTPLLLRGRGPEIA